jgi:hypothetical protein
MPATIIALARDPLHRVSKLPANRLRLIAGLGVEGDAHAGLTMQHRSRWVKQRTVPNLRQVHLIHAELFDELADKGFSIAPAQMGENVTTRGITCWASRRERGCGSEARRWSSSPACETPASSSTASLPG